MVHTCIGHDQVRQKQQSVHASLGAVVYWTPTTPWHPCPPRPPFFAFFFSTPTRPNQPGGAVEAALAFPQPSKEQQDIRAHLSFGSNRPLHYNVPRNISAVVLGNKPHENNPNGSEPRGKTNACLQICYTLVIFFSSFTVFFFFSA